MGVVGILHSGIAGELDYRDDGVDLQFGSPCASKQGDVQVWIGDLDFGPVYGYADGIEMVDQQVFHAMAVGGNRDACKSVRSGQNSLEKRTRKPDAKGNGANNSRGKDGCSYKCRRSFTQLDYKYRKYGIRSRFLCLKNARKSLSFNELRQDDIFLGGGRSVSNKAPVIKQVRLRERGAITFLTKR